METTIYRIRPGADDEPEAKPPVDVWLAQLDDRIAWVVGEAVVAVLRPDGRYDRYRICADAAKEAGIALDDNGFIEAAFGDDDLNDIATLIANAVRVERNACAQVAEEHKPVPPTIALPSSIAARIRARGGNSDGEGA